VLPHEMTRHADTGVKWGSTPREQLKFIRKLTCTVVFSEKTYW
jgi:hypothetical protein